MIQAAPMQFLLELDFLTVGKVSAICRACTRAPVHLVQFETGFRRRYHLERSRHFWGNIYLRIKPSAVQKKNEKVLSGRHLTVFNTQDLLQVGGRWKHTLESPFQVQGSR